MAEHDPFKEFGGNTLTVADRHNNPLNMKVGGLTKRYIDMGLAQPGEKAKDGGQFLKFDTPENGHIAARDLLFSGFYKNMDLNSAMKTWSGQGYGAEVAPQIPGDKKLSEFTPEERSTLVNAMAKKEGYSQSTYTNPFEEFGGDVIITPKAEVKPPPAGGPRPTIPAPAKSEYALEDTGVVAGLKRAWHNINPVNIIEGMTAPPDVITKQNYEERMRQYKEGLERMAGHPVGTVLRAGVPAVGGMAADVAERLPKDPTGAIAEGSVYAVVPKVVEKAVGTVAGKYKYAQNRKAVFSEPEGHLVRALNPDLDEAGIKEAGSQLKAGEAKIGEPVKDINTARAAARAQFEQDLMPLRRSIIDPQKDVTVPGSRRKLVMAKIDAIPKDILPGTPEHDNLVENARASVPGDLTIGELEDITSSLNSQNRAYHQARLSQALSKLENANGAMNVASEQTARNLMQEGMDAHGLGGADKLKQVNHGIGSLIRLEDSLDVAEKQARVEASRPFLSRGFRGTTINEGLANAMRLWKNLPSFIASGPEWGPTARTRLLSPGTSIDLGPSPDTSSVRGGPAIYTPSGTPRQITAEASSPYALGEGGPVAGTGPSTVTGEEGQLAKGPFTGKPIVGKMGDRLTVPNVPIKKGVPLETTMEGGAVQPNLFGIGQTIDPKFVPPGTKLAFKSKLLDGTEQYHYQTPDGTIFTSDTELDLKKIGANRPYEPGSSWRGSPYEPPLPPPPKRTKRKL